MPLRSREIQIIMTETALHSAALESNLMNPDDQHSLKIVFDYHQRTKHHIRQYARSLGYMDWATQPDPFRTYRGAEPLLLERPSQFTGRSLAQ